MKRNGQNRRNETDLIHAGGLTVARVLVSSYIQHRLVSSFIQHDLPKDEMKPTNRRNQTDGKTDLIHEGRLPSDRVLVQHRLLRLAEHKNEQLLRPHDAVDRLRRRAAPKKANKQSFWKKTKAPKKTNTYERCVVLLIILLKY